MRKIIKAKTGSKTREELNAWSEAAADAIIPNLTDNQIRAVFRAALESNELTRGEKEQIANFYFSI